MSLQFLPNKSIKNKIYSRVVERQKERTDKHTVQQYSYVAANGHGCSSTPVNYMLNGSVMINWSHKKKQKRR
jgi:hypothetical protein